jgi:hypothetical protein
MWGVMGIVRGQYWVGRIEWGVSEGDEWDAEEELGAVLGGSYFGLGLFSKS